MLIVSPFATAVPLLWTVRACSAGAVESVSDVCRLVPLVEQQQAPLFLQKLVSVGHVDDHDFWLTSEINLAASQWLVLPEVAGFAQVWHGEQLIGVCDNSFVPHWFQLPKGTATLTLRFPALRKQLKQKHPRPRWKTRMVSDQALRWYRTSLQGRVTSWPEGQPEVGLPQDPRIVGNESAFDVQLWVDHAARRVRVRVDLPSTNDLSDLRLAFDDGPNQELEGASSLTAEVEYPEAAPWWPHTHGDPRTHTLRLCAGDRTLRKWDIGFRSATFDDEGLKINGRRVFCRGTCMSADRTDSALLTKELTQLRDAGCNMVRIVGTSNYASTDLLKLCDSLGMMVWQDGAFASLDYPTGDEFAASVTNEVTHQLERLRAHPSVVMFAGNSEVDQQATFMGRDRQTASHPLFVDLLASVARDHGDGLSYLSGSPSSGVSGGSTKLSTHSDTGVSHYFGVGAYQKPLEDRSIDNVRFASECLGFSHIPGAQSLRESFGSPYPNPRSAHWRQGVPFDNGVSWDFEDIRDHYLAELFEIDAEALRKSDHPTYLRLGQATSSEVVSRTMSRWRSSLSRCNGALTWTHRDWVDGAGWGLFDARHRAKPALHALARVSQPLALLLLDSDFEGFCVEIVNDMERHLSGTLRVGLIGRDGTTQLESDTPIHSEADRLRISVDEVFGQFTDANYCHRFGPQQYTACYALLLDSEGQSLAEAWRLVRPRLHCFDGKPSIDARLEQTAEGYRLVLSASRAAFFVEADADGWLPEDSHFHLRPGQTRSLALSPLAPEQALKRCTVRTLSQADQLVVRP